jgi:type IV pilus assembly protein PilC
MDAGEQTSTINRICIKIADQYTREVDSSVSTLVKWVEPLAILFAGVFVLWFAFGIFSAVLKITETV